MAVTSSVAPITVTETAYGTVETIEGNVRTTATTETAVREYFKDIPVMIEIARCESTFRQFDNTGTVLKNKTSSAKGAFQIMESLHKEPALKLGHDILTLEGNMGYARYLYEKQGTRPWNASAKCWNKTVAMN